MSRRGSSSLLLLLVVVLFAAAVAPTGAAAAKRSPDQAKVAKKLAAGLHKARTSSARRRALLKTMRALGVGVYTGRGKAHVRGAERHPTDVYLYDFELKALVAEMGSKETVNADDLAARLTTSGVKQRGGGVLTGADLNRGLVAGVRNGKKRRKKASSLGVLLIDALGRRARRPVTGPDARLDALQSWIVAAEAGLVRSKRGRAPSRLAAPGEPALGAAALRGKPCFKGQRRVKKVVSGLGSLSEKLGGIIGGISNAVVGPIHGIALAALVDFQPTATGNVTRTHYGPPGHRAEIHEPGRHLVFQVGVQLVVDPPDFAVKCGPLAGLEWPTDKKGPVPDVPIEWDGIISDGLDTLKRHGTIVRMDEKTGGDGIARLEVRPNDDGGFAIGREIDEFGTIQPEAQIWTAFGNSLGGSFNEAFLPLATTMGFTVSYHKPRGYKVSFTSARGCFPTCDEFSQYTEVAYDVAVCGPTPYNVEWTGTMEEREWDGRPKPDDSNRNSFQDRIAFVLFPDQTSVVYRPGLEGDSRNRTDFMLQELDTTWLRIDTFRSNVGSQQYSDYGRAVVEENTQCPPPS